MEKDKRYTTVRNLISGGFIKTFNEIFDTLPKSTVAADLGFNNARINRLLNNVELFIVRDLFRLAELLEVPDVKLMELACNQRAADKATKKSSPAKKRNKKK